MSRASLIVRVLLLAAAGAFAVGLVRLVVLRFQAGDIYPPYSSLRSDPLGTKVLYQAVAETPGMVVARNFLPPRRLIGRLGSTLLYLGAGAPGQAQAMDKDFAECLRRFASAGGRVVIAFSPAAGGRLVSGFIPDDVGPLGAEFGFVLAGREEPPLPETSARRAVPAGGQDWLAGLAWHTPMYFEPSDPEWRTVYACDDRPVVIERPLGRGSVAVCSDSYALSNEAMAYRRDSRFLAWVLSGREAVFDETHLGVAEETDIAALGRRYGLGGALGVLLLLAGLHVWKSWASFLPRQSVSPAGHEHGGVIGEASTAGLLNLLRRAIPRRRLASVCVEEWSRSAGRLEGSARAALEQARRAAEQEQCAPARRQDPLSAYRTVRGTLSERSHRHAI